MRRFISCTILVIYECSVSVGVGAVLTEPKDITAFNYAPAISDMSKPAEDQTTEAVFQELDDAIIEVDKALKICEKSRRI